MFFVGDFVVGNTDRQYCYTDNGSLCVVTKISDDNLGGFVKVIATTHDDIDETLGKEFPVRFEFFTRVIDPEGWINNHRAVTEPDWQGEIPFVEVKSIKGGMEMEQNVEFNRDTLVSEATELLTTGFNGEDFDYPVTDDGLGTIMDEWWKNKESLDDILAHHPNYVKGKHYIAIPGAKIKRGINRTQVHEFCNWARKNVPEPKEYVHTAWTYKEAVEHRERCGKIYNAVQRLYDYGSPSHVAVFGTETAETLKESYRFWCDICTEYEELGSSYTFRENHCFLRSDDKRYYTEKVFFNIIEEYFNGNGGSLATESIADELNSTAMDVGVDLRAVAGQKMSRIVGRFCKAIGLNEVVEIGTTYSGRAKDYGYNYQYALFSDAINVLEFTNTFVVSVNPIDYWTMSFGKSWQSCRTIDKQGKRGASHEDDAHNYSGMYSSGTESYMLDSVSMIVYTVDSNWDGGSLQNLEKAPKNKRNVFCWGKDKLLQSRLYPDGRNNAEHDIDDLTSADQFRAIMQKIMADCLDVPNMWKLKRGTEICTEVTHSRGTHYTDYECYEDCNVSFLQTGTELNKEPITVGHDPICPNCGEEHCEEDNICCPDCQHDGEVQCEYCGEWIDPDDAIYCQDNGNYYCDSGCAENDDIHYCEDDGEYHDEENCFHDDYEDKWFSDDSDIVNTDDGNTYRSPENALEDGYVEDHDGNWYPADHMHYCSHCDQWYFDDEWDEDHQCCNDCTDEVVAETEAEVDSMEAE